MSQSPDLEKAKAFANDFQNLKAEIKKVIIGQDEIVDLLLISLFSRGHCVLVGVPGLAKTLLIRTLADVLGLSYNRIQFTPDLMPSDITGTEIIEDHASGGKAFKFIKGPIFANIILADEINRTPPKTQAALLEAMQEYHVTAAGTTYHLDQPFFVLATQNPIEQEGTYPLPEAQLDRFMFNLWLDYPSFENEMTIVKQTTAPRDVTLASNLDADTIKEYQKLIRFVEVPENVLEFVVKLVSSTRPKGELASALAKKFLAWGAGPRASQYLVIGAKAKALAEGRFSISMADVHSLAKPVLRHRIVTNYSAEAEGLSTDALIDDLLNTIS